VRLPVAHVVVFLVNLPPFTYMVCYFITKFKCDSEIGFDHMHANVDVTDVVRANYANLLSPNLHIGARIALLCVRSPALLYPATLHLDSCSFASFCRRIATHLV
jgi:hypothetical protein